jgi:hypothetical protein
VDAKNTKGVPVRSKQVTFIKGVVTFATGVVAFVIVIE